MFGHEFGQKLFAGSSPALRDDSWPKRLQKSSAIVGIPIDSVLRIEYEYLACDT